MDTRKGLVSIFGIWLTMAMMPIAELLPLSPYQLLVLRGAPAMLLFFIIGVRSDENPARAPDKYTLLTSLAFALACIGLFNAIKSWGANLSAVLLDMAVLVNFIFALIRKERISSINWICYTTAIFGSFIALRAWNVYELNIDGFLWSMLALIANGLFIEWNSKAMQKVPTKIFWWGLTLTSLGLLFSIKNGEHWARTPILLALFFGITTGALNFLCAITAFTNLRPIWVGTLVLGVTPSILIGSYFITGRTLGVDQLMGVILVLSSIGYLGYWLSKKGS